MIFTFGPGDDDDDDHDDDDDDDDDGDDDDDDGARGTEARCHDLASSGL